MASKISRYGPAVVAWFLLLGVTGVFYALVIPGVIKEFRFLGIVLTIGESILLVAVVVNFYMATVMDPGILPKATESEEQQQDEFRAPLYKNMEVRGISVRMKWCTTCHFYRPPRCSHCSICDRCIETFDHHCPWLNNCIGRRNYRQFFIFLLLLSLHIVFVFVLCLVYTLKMKNDLLTKENLGSMSVMVLGGMLFVPIIGLTGFHVFLVVSGRTTNEQVTGKFRSGFNPFNRGLCKNVAWICFGPQFPKFSNYIGKQQVIDFEAINREKSQSASLLEVTSPLLNFTTIPGGNNRPTIVTATNLDSARIHLRSIDEDRIELGGKRLNEHIRRSSENTANNKHTTTDGGLGAERARGIVPHRSKSSALGDHRSDDILLSDIGTGSNELSRDSSLTTVRSFPKTMSGGFPSRLGVDLDESGIASMETQGSKCNLLDETGSALAAPGVLVQHQQDQQGHGVSSPGNERYQQALREAYSGTLVQHKPPIAARSTTRPQFGKGGISPNGPEWGAPARAFAGANSVQRFAYVPPSALLESTVVNKSQSMDALARQQQSPSVPPAPRLSVAPTLSLSVTADPAYKRPLSFTQAVQLHDSLTRLNNSTRSATPTAPASDVAYASRQRSDTAGSSPRTSNVNEIRV